MRGQNMFYKSGFVLEKVEQNKFVLEKVEQNAKSRTSSAIANKSRTAN